MYANGERVLDVENRAHLAVDLRAILDADAVLRRCRRPRPVDEHPHHVTGRLATALDVPDRQAARCRHSFGNRPNLLQRLHHRAGLQVGARVGPDKGPRTHDLRPSVP